MNNVCLVGRLTADPTLGYTQDNRAYSRINLAVDRGLSKEDKEAGKQSADFISCVFWNKNAENLCNYCSKGSQISIVGAIRTSSYTDVDGNKRYSTDVRVNSLRFLGSKSKDDRPDPEYDGPSNEGYDPYAEYGEAVTIDDNFLD